MIIVAVIKVDIGCGHQGRGHHGRCLQGWDHFYLDSSHHDLDGGGDCVYGREDHGVDCSKGHGYPYGDHERCHAGGCGFRGEGSYDLHCVGDRREIIVTVPFKSSLGQGRR